MAVTQLKTVRAQLGYKADAVIGMLIVRAGQLSMPVMTSTSLKTKLSQWENGRSAVSAPYQQLFRDIYGRTNEELGFPPVQMNDDAAELRARLAIARSVDGETVNAFRRQVDSARYPDRKFGGVTLLDELRGNIKRIEGMLGYSTVRGHRKPLAGVLTEASTLAGWLALDRNAIGQAWDHYERAKAAARESGSPGLLAHATAEQAFVLIDLGEIAPAVAQLAEARTLAGGHVSSLLASWLAAAQGEGLAAAGHRDDALQAFDDADTLLPTDPVDPELPFLFLGDSHLDRWRGNALVMLGEANAIDQLSDALERLPSAFIRAKVGMLVDLAFAYATAGDRAAAQHHARQARRLGLQIKSDRQLRRLSRLVLPGGASPVA